MTIKTAAAAGFKDVVTFLPRTFGAKKSQHFFDICLNRSRKKYFDAKFQNRVGALDHKYAKRQKLDLCPAF
jgi:hypothetical protein